jgi:hypothetical protein
MAQGSRPFRRKRAGNAKIDQLLPTGAAILSAHPPAAQEDSRMTSTFAPREPRGGQPSAGSSQSVADLEQQVAYHRAFEAVLWAMPALAIYRMRLGFLEVPGVTDNVVLAYSTPMPQLGEFITPNNTTPYIGMTADLRQGPLVVSVPAATDKASLYGQIVDAWQSTIADVGPAGADGGKGGKYLLLPPGHDGAVPDGYLPIRASSYRIIFAFRSVAAPGASAADAYAYSKTLQAYPFAQAANPPATRFVDPSEMPLKTLPIYDLTALADIREIIEVEPARPRDSVMAGMLATIGIEKGKPFAPPERLKGAMERGVIDAWFYMQKRVRELHLGNLYWPDRHWGFSMVSDAASGFEFANDEMVEVDKRATAWNFFTLYPRKLNDKAGVVYLAPIADSSGNLLAPGRNYRLRVPADVPARQFWSLTMYNEATWSFIPNPLGRSGLSSFEKSAMAMNADGSVDLYFGPDEPESGQSNWIPTMGKTPFLWFRFYGPGESFWDKSFKLPDVEAV